jgi:putative transposase
MKELGLKAIYPEPKTSQPNKEHKKYPYLLRSLEITHINQVWASDITYIKYRGSFMYLVAIIDIYTRKVLSWRLSNTIDSHFCCECLSEAISFFGVPEIFNTDQGSQFTCSEFIEILNAHNIQISMDGKGRALDNVYIERIWRTLKYENIFLYDYGTVKELRKGIDRFFKFYNTERFHQSLNYKTPDDIYFQSASSF